jgi:hypothetical protein
LQGAVRVLDRVRIHDGALGRHSPLRFEVELYDGPDVLDRAHLDHAQGTEADAERAHLAQGQVRLEAHPLPIHFNPLQVLGNLVQERLLEGQLAGGGVVGPGHVSGLPARLDDRREAFGAARQGLDGKVGDGQADRRLGRVHTLVAGGPGGPRRLDPLGEFRGGVGQTLGDDPADHVRHGSGDLRADDTDEEQDCRDAEAEGVVGRSTEVLRLVGSGATCGCQLEQGLDE